MKTETDECKKHHLLEGVAAITKILKGPLNDLERAFLVAYRKDVREELRKLETGKVKP